MKKLLLLFITLLLISSCTTLNQVDKYGTVDDIVRIENGKYRIKAWDGKKYYTVITNYRYQIGETIKLK